MRIWKYIREALLLTCCASLFSFFNFQFSICHAQTIANDTSTFEVRFGHVNQAYAKSPEAVDALFDMAMLYFDNALPLRNLPMAMSFAKRAEYNYLMLMTEDKHGELTRLIRRGIVLATVQQLKEAVRDAALNTVNLRDNLTVAELDEYLEVFADDAEIASIVRQRRILQAYEADIQAATPQSYYHIIETLPHTDEARKAEAKLATVAATLFDGMNEAEEIDAVAARYAASPSVTRAAAAKKSRLAFAETISLNTITSYKEYLRQYPSSDESQQVRDLLDGLLNIQYGTLRTAKELADFADSNADNALADKALEQIRHLIADNRDVQAARLYLDRYRFDPHYNEVYATYYSWYAEEGNGELLARFEEENPDSPMRYALERDQERTMIIDNIDLMEPYSEDEFHTYSTHIRQSIGKKVSFVPLQRMLQQLTLAGDYETASGRMNQFEICFDDVMTDEYNELKEILDAPAENLQSVQLTVPGNMTNPCINAVDNRIYGNSGNIIYNLSNEVDGDIDVVVFSNDTNYGLTLFNFFDGGEKMLLGKDGDILIAEREDTSWRISDILPYPVNTDYTETDAFMLPDGSGLLLASDRPGGQNLQQSGSYFHGDTALATDLYFIPCRHGLWGTPVNLGTTINSPYCERSPHMSGDLRTLYFITDSRGMGYGDIYTATRTSSEDWTSWTKPRNLGREVNTSFNEASVSLSPDENTLLKSTNSDGSYTCYAITLNDKPKSSHSNYRLDVLGLEEKTFRVRVADISQQEVTQVLEYIGNSGNVDLDINSGKRYLVFADVQGYFVPAVIIAPDSRPVRLQGYTYPTLVGLDKAVPLPAIDFMPSSSVLTPLAKMQVEQLAQFLKRETTAVAEIDVDVAGIDDELAYDLSLERGRMVKDRLSTLGIDGNRVIVSAYGNSRTKRGTPEGISVQFR